MMTEKQRFILDEDVASDAQHGKHPANDKAALLKRAKELEAQIDAMTEYNFDLAVRNEYVEILKQIDPVVASADVEGFRKRFFEKHSELLNDTPAADGAAPIIKGSNSPHHRRLGRMLVAVVAAACLVGFTCLSAVGSNIFERIAEWTDETFRFSINQTAQPIITSGYVSGAVQQEEALGSSEQDRIIITENNTIDLTQYASLQEALRADGIETSLIPVYIPDGFELSTIKKVDTGNIVRYMARYIKDRNKTILLSFDVYHALSDGGGMQKDEREVECYNANGVDFYIMSNLKRMSAIAFVGSTEVSISGDISVDEIKQMIDSTHEGD